MKPKKRHENEVGRGKGGETHQIADGDVPVLTTQQGTPVADDQNSLKVGPRGPTTLDDFHLREKIFHFDHERIPEPRWPPEKRPYVATSKPANEVEPEQEYL